MIKNNNNYFYDCNIVVSLGQTLKDEHSQRFENDRCSNC